MIIRKLIKAGLRSDFAKGIAERGRKAYPNLAKRIDGAKKKADAKLKSAGKNKRKKTTGGGKSKPVPKGKVRRVNQWMRVFTAQNKRRAARKAGQKPPTHSSFQRKLIPN